MSSLLWSNTTDLIVRPKDNGGDRNSMPSHTLLPSPQHSSLFPTGDKFLLRWYRGYLISVSYGGRGGGARTSSIASGQGGVRETMTLSIYDIQNQFVGEWRG